VSSTTTTAAVLAATPSQVSAGSAAAIGGTMLVLVVLGAITWYCVKHKGWDMPQILMGYALAIVVSGVTWGAQVNGAFSSGISAAVGAIAKAVSNSG
jgi:hypothetical protein